VDISYHAQSLPGEDLVIRSGLTKVGRTSFTIRQEVRKGSASGPLAADATIAFVCIGRDGRPVQVPEQWSAMFPRWSDAEGATDGARS
jgi:acyl-CoA thioesterase FadM